MHTSSCITLPFKSLHSFSSKQQTLGIHFPLLWYVMCLSGQKSYGFIQPRSHFSPPKEGRRGKWRVKTFEPNDRHSKACMHASEELRIGYAWLNKLMVELQTRD